MTLLFYQCFSSVSITTEYAMALLEILNCIAQQPKQINEKLFDFSCHGM